MEGLMHKHQLSPAAIGGSTAMHTKKEQGQKRDEEHRERWMRQAGDGGEDGWMEGAEGR